ncbi:GntR family transcriptional regulator [Streptomyces sp. NPDC004031]
MTTAGSRPEAKYQRIARELREQIENGRYGPGERLPGENDLMAGYGVARMTARQALGVLQAEGVAEARKGAGVFVREFRPVRRRGIARLAREGWSGGRSVWEADAEGRELGVEVGEVGVAEAPDAVAGVLGTGAVVVRRRRFVLDGKPVLLATSYFPAGIVTGSRVAEEDTGPGGVYARLAELGYEPVRFREEVRARMPSGEEARRLELRAGTPVVLVCRTAYTGDGTPVEVNEMVLDSAAYVLEYAFGS